MRRSLGFVLATATVASLLFAGNALATPGKSSLCSGCHSISSAVTVTPTFRGCNGTTATYGIAVSNTYSGAEGWAVFDGGSNIQNALGATGTFNVPGGKTYDVWGVSKGGSDMGGSNHVGLTAECASSGSCTATTSYETGALCRDLQDNDCDGLTDLNDDGCQEKLMCDDGVDNDGDGKADCCDKKDCGKACRSNGWTTQCR